MDNTERPLEEYFASARNERGISEEETRAILRERLGSDSSGSRGDGRSRRSLTVMAILATLIGISIFSYVRLVDDSPATSAVGSTRPLPGKASKADSTISLPAASTMDVTTPSPLPTVEHSRGAGGSVPFPRTLNNNYQTDRNNSMNTDSISRKVVTMMAMVSATSISLTAQNIHPKHGPETKDTPPILKQMHQEMGIAVSEYWQTRLNGYKNTIDQMLTPEDLTALNTLRVRFAVLVSDLIAMKDSGSLKITAKMNPKALDEVKAIYLSTKELAGRYQGGLHSLGEGVLHDFGGFLGEMHTQSSEFITRHRAELEQAGVAKDLEEGFKEAEAEVSAMTQGEGKMMFKMFYSFALEPIIMLYDGTDLKTLMQQVGAMSSAGGGMSLPAGALPGITLPESSLLNQNTPNPASTRASISYTLPEASRNTVLRIYNAQGEQVGIYDQGSQGAGQQSVVVDVSSLPPGTYLYHLKATTSKGVQVYSKTMQVAR